MRKTILSFTFIGTTVAAFIACSSGGSGGGGGGGGPTTSVDSSKTGANLSDTEAKQYCEDLQAYQKAQISEDEQKKFSCGFTAQLLASFTAKDDAEAQSKCKSELDKCLAKPPTAADAGSTADACESFMQRLKSCNATVAELNQCTGDSTAQLKSLATKDFCADAKADAGFASSPLLQQPESCKALASKCPSLFGTQGATPDGG